LASERPTFFSVYNNGVWLTRSIANSPAEYLRYRFSWRSMTILTGVGLPVHPFVRSFGLPPVQRAPRRRRRWTTSCTSTTVPLFASGESPRSVLSTVSPETIGGDGHGTRVAWLRHAIRGEARHLGIVHVCWRHEAATTPSPPPPPSLPPSSSTSSFLSRHAPSTYPRSIYNPLSLPPLFRHYPRRKRKRDRKKALHHLSIG